ncbi:MotA/TolQ/ExbB proton channel family protein [uncultured Alistipes sp.]|uniref:MotA/TolQ/ExbB proton channel family protein n=1 Tax=uncultured Alistipes sp. TaxID=538949 RepID=UPI00261AE61A|nr:MotA/TolQ/ExbB proton channel family protein [uncultured Alistipes sp.]
MNYISDILYWISTGLLVPDIVLLIFFFGRSLLLIGSFFGQYLSIRRTASLIGRELDGLTPQTVATLAERLPKKNPSLLVVYLNRLLEARDNAPLRLIPMGPALVGLSTGDIASMAYNMQVAFATTVVGLFAAAIGFITQQVKQRWYLKDLSNLEFVAELLNAQTEKR